MSDTPLLVKPLRVFLSNYLNASGLWSDLLLQISFLNYLHQRFEMLRRDKRRLNDAFIAAIQGIAATNHTSDVKLKRAYCEPLMHK